MKKGDRDGGPGEAGRSRAAPAGPATRPPSDRATERPGHRATGPQSPQPPTPRMLEEERLVEHDAPAPASGARLGERLDQAFRDPLPGHLDQAQFRDVEH